MSCTETNGAPLGTRFDTNCLEAVIQTLMVTTDDFAILQSDINDMAAWEAAIVNEDVVPLFEVYEPSSESTEATKYETGNFTHRTSKAVKKLKAELYLSLCGHKSLASLEDSKYTRVIEITEEGQLALVKKTGTTNMYQGQSIKDFDVSMRKRATKDKAPYTELLVTFTDFKEFENQGYYFDVDFNPIIDLKGVYGVEFEVISVTGPAVVVRITAGCGNTIENLDVANLEFIDDAANNPVTLVSLNNVSSNTYVVTMSGPVSTGELGTRESAGVIGVTEILGDYYVGKTKVSI